MPIPSSGIPAAIRDGMSALAKSRVWIPDDFADLGPRGQSGASPAGGPVNKARMYSTTSS
jgi:hypothetical protein